VQQASRTGDRFRALEEVTRRAESLRWARAGVSAAEGQLETAIRRARRAGASTDELAAAASVGPRRVKEIVETDRLHESRAGTSGRAVPG
jgi:hypothetical protein